MSQESPPLSRRSFLKRSSAFGAISIVPSYIALGNKSSSGLAPSEKVRLAVIGAGNRGHLVRRALVGTGLCDVVALCDVDMEGEHTHVSRWQHGLASNPPAARMRKDGTPEPTPHVFPIKARGFTDFRVMFDEMADDIDAVLVATPDHAHFSATMLAMSLGKHVYVEKPLAHTFGQCQRMMDYAAAHPEIVTQMGNQGHSGANYFQFKAWREAGIIKDITHITARMNSHRGWHGWGEQQTEYFSDAMPSHINWDVWQDSVDFAAPFSKKLHPREWRSWYTFGSGAFGDWGPHLLDTCHRFLELGYPEQISAVNLKGRNASGLVFPQASTIRFDFPNRGPGLPACNVTWYDGRGNFPVVEAPHTESGVDEVADARPGKILYSKELAFQGGSHGSALRIIPKAKFKDMRSSLPRIGGKNSNHEGNFLLACKGEETTRSPFSVGGSLTQMLNLGVIAQRLGGDLKFDAKAKQFVGNPAANALLDPAPRRGWEQYYNI